MSQTEGSGGLSSSRWTSKNAVGNILGPDETLQPFHNVGLVNHLVEGLGAILLRPHFIAQLSASVTY